MTPDELTPDEFARLLALPEDHPDRKRAMESPLFESRRLLYAQFVAPGADVTPRETLAYGERELTARLPSMIGAPETPAAAPAPRVRAGSWWDSLRRALSPSGMRLAVSFAAVLAIVAVVWLVPRGPATRAVRGPAETAAFELADPHTSGQTVELTWGPHPQADQYRVVFYGADLGVIASVDSLVQPRFTLRGGALPAGLQSGSTVFVSVIAMHAGDPIAESQHRPVRVP